MPSRHRLVVERVEARNSVSWSLEMLNSAGSTPKQAPTGEFVRRYPKRGLNGPD